MRAFLYLLKAEHIEHRGGQLWTPVVVGLLLTILMAIGIFHNGSMVLSVGIDTDSGMVIQSMDDVKAAIRDEVGEENAGPVLQAVAFGSIYLTLVPLLLIAFVVSYFLLIGSMHNERVDRSILFWKSMPVSDFMVAVSKFLASTLGTLFVATAIGTVVVLIAMLLHGGAGPFSDGPEWDVVAHPLVAASTILMVLGTCVFYVLWAAPVYGWIMLASAWAPRSPMLYVTIPPVALGILEMMLLHSNKLWTEIWQRCIGSFLNMDLPLGHTVFTSSDLSGLLLGQIGNMADATMTPRFWIGLAVTLACIWGASEVRRRRVA